MDTGAPQKKNRTSPVDKTLTARAKNRRMGKSRITDADFLKQAQISSVSKNGQSKVPIVACSETFTHGKYFSPHPRVHTGDFKHLVGSTTLRWQLGYTLQSRLASGAWRGSVRQRRGKRRRRVRGTCFKRSFLCSGLWLAGSGVGTRPNPRDAKDSTGGHGRNIGA